MRSHLIYIFAAAVTLAVALAYWPVLHAGFVWDDWRSFHDTPWLTQGDLWKHYIFRDFNSWTYYFRPIPLALLTLQVRLFGSTPGPMHAISLALHLVDMLLVGALSWRCAKLAGRPVKVMTGVSTLCMLLYGLHPALIEPVSWIGCQFDLIATCFMLLGLLANAWIERPTLRATAVGLSFLVAACSKESAAVFPLLMLLFDWILFAYRADDRLSGRIKALAARNVQAYLAVLISGLVYLAFRRWALGGIASSFETQTLTPLGRLQEVCMVCLSYWRMLVWPVAGMSPIHPYDPRVFASVTPWSLSITGMVIGVVAGSVFAVLNRGAALACIVLAATVALLPVLHIIPVEFEQSLYHERYAMLSIAVVCSMLPLLRWPSAQKSLVILRATKMTAAVAISLWLAFAVIAIQLIVPNWSSDANLWSWALLVQPHSSQAKNNLLHTYIKDRNVAATRALGDRILADSVPCTYCTLVIAKLALDEKDLARAQLALQKSEQPTTLSQDPSLLRDYYVVSGRLLAMRGLPEEAADAFRQALSLTPNDTDIQRQLQDVIQNEASGQDR